MKHIAILGSTGSIGRSALAVVDEFADRLQIVGLAAGENSSLFAEQVEKYRPEIVALATDDALTTLKLLLGSRHHLETYTGSEGLIAVATHPSVDLVLCASAGTAALEAVLAAIDARKTIALANKEVLVMAGGLVMAAARETGVSILPVDSEHNAIHQCLHSRAAHEIRRLILTASGGPFRGRNRGELDGIAPDDALQHPTWKMGRKISIDSATLMNKGLEVIEAHWLFNVPPHRIDVVIHPQSVVHSMVELLDGSVIAQLGITDMRLPIQYAFAFPDRWSSSLPTLDLTRCAALEFGPPDLEAFPCLRLAYRALQEGESTAVVLNASNEIAVDAFLERRLSFAEISRLVERAIDAHHPIPVRTLADVRSVDRWARQYSLEQVGAIAR